MISTRQAEHRRDTGMERAAAHTERSKPGWSADADAAIELYCLAHAEPFLSEDVRDWSEAMEFVEPPAEPRAWGNVMRRAAKCGLIRKAGYAPARSSNLSPKVLWRSA